MARLPYGVLSNSQLPHRAWTRLQGWHPPLIGDHFPKQGGDRVRALEFLASLLRLPITTAVGSKNGLRCSEQLLLLLSCFLLHLAGSRGTAVPLGVRRAAMLVRQEPSWYIIATSLTRYVSLQGHDHCPRDSIATSSSLSFHHARSDSSSRLAGSFHGRSCFPESSWEIC
jgi:hypothetical protein